MDMFGSGLSNGVIGAPAWLDLPAESPALMSLVTQSIQGYAARTATLPLRRSIMISAGCGLIIWSAKIH
ncbi:hypothetical protein CQ14_29550 [Bradyrhizobium lablabi]|uniref:Uncharacterized protein n=1 Tax=Bradyrhizobium lablabi TaxID=722472 RepID=A0A0R3MIU9_9BRAD|nr:hypothetical protein [Bradyrhizobium lablabi]KRR20274.1 hypothetical protein CQ14_29550 [Bradyrhizobium lablabi]